MSDGRRPRLKLGGVASACVEPTEALLTHHEVASRPPQRLTIDTRFAELADQTPRSGSGVLKPYRATSGGFRLR
jgi:hypothetical protein